MLAKIPQISFYEEKFKPQKYFFVIFSEKLEGFQDEQFKEKNSLGQDRDVGEENLQISQLVQELCILKKIVSPIYFGLKMVDKLCR